MVVKILFSQFELPLFSGNIENKKKSVTSSPTLVVTPK
jgi:hypothetical protein